MLRAAAKNHRFVTVVTDTEDYARLVAELDSNGGATTEAFRRDLAQITYARTAAYDAAVSGWLAGALDLATPRRRAFAGTLAQPLRYGENPHQSAAFYRDGSGRPGVASARQWQGKELSYNNINDTDAAFELVADLGRDAPACAIIKHANPCGVATAPTLLEAYRRAYDCDRTSAFGGIVALNRPLDGATAEEIAKIFTEVVIAPDADADARGHVRHERARQRRHADAAGELPAATVRGEVGVADGAPRVRRAGGERPRREAERQQERCRHEQYRHVELGAWVVRRDQSGDQEDAGDQPSSEEGQEYPGGTPREDVAAGCFQRLHDHFSFAVLSCAVLSCAVLLCACRVWLRNTSSRLWRVSCSE